MSCEWVPIPGYEGLYEVSTEGEVRSLSRLVKNGGRRNFITPTRLMSLAAGNDYGHLHTTLTDANGRSRKHWVHRLVAITFIPNPMGYPYVLHGPGGKHDNSVANLRWGTAQMNSDDKEIHGTVPVHVPSTHCGKGHEFTEENTYRPPSKPESRMCKECMRANVRRQRQLHPERYAYKPKVLEPRACQQCGKSFMPKRRGDAVYCSAACKSAWHREHTKC